MIDRYKSLGGNNFSEIKNILFLIIIFVIFGMIMYSLSIMMSTPANKIIDKMKDRETLNDDIRKIIGILSEIGDDSDLILNAMIKDSVDFSDKNSIFEFSDMSELPSHDDTPNPSGEMWLVDDKSSRKNRGTSDSHLQKLLDENRKRLSTKQRAIEMLSGMTNKKNTVRPTMWFGTSG